MNLVEQLDRLSHPASQSAIVVCFGLLCLCWRRYRVGAGSIAVATLWLGLCSTPAVATWLQRGLESQYPPRDATSYPTADAIVVLGGGEIPSIGEASTDEASEEGATRVGFGLELFRQGRAPIILLSGGHREATQMARRLEQQHVPTAALRIEDASGDTHQNALYSDVLLKREKLQRILLVTSALHMPRATASFERQGLVVIPASTSGLPSPTATSWLPHRAALKRSGRCLREYFGLWIYKLRDWA